MRATLRGIDHVLVGVKDLAAANEQWNRLGFTSAPLGRHVGRKTGNHCILFPDDYIELIGIVDPDGPASRLDEILRTQGDSLIASALSPTDADKAHKDLTEAGVAPQDIVLLRRPIEAPDGSPAEAQFRNFDFPLAATPGFRLFCCYHLTPDLVKQPQWLTHANGVTGVAGITVVTTDPDEVEKRLEKLFGAGSVARTDDVVTVHAGRHRLIYALAKDIPDLYPEVDGLEGRPPHGLAIRFTVGDPALVRRQLTGQRIPFTEGDDGSLFVAPAHATGVLLQFG
jgi:catechol 2,3-dioxygenase-like lactoylglutathione lyase family enzyme